MRSGLAGPVKRSAVAATLTLILGISAAPSPAQELRPSAGRWEVGIDLGASQFAATDVEPLGTRVALSTSRALTGSLAATFDITCTNGIERFPGLGLEADFTICTGSLGAAYNLPFTPRIWPYVRVAAGQAQLDRLAAEKIRHRRRLALAPGGRRGPVLLSKRCESRSARRSAVASHGTGGARVPERERWSRGRLFP